MTFQTGNGATKHKSNIETDVEKGDECKLQRLDRHVPVLSRLVIGF